MVLTWEAKVIAAADAANAAAETNWKHKSHPRLGWLIYCGFKTEAYCFYTPDDSQLYYGMARFIQR